MPPAKKLDDPIGIEQSPGVYAFLAEILKRQDEGNQQRIHIVEMQRDLKAVGEELRVLVRAVRGDGNGERGLAVRMVLVEQEMAKTTSILENLIKVIETRSTEAEKGKWTLTNTVVLAIFTLLSAVVAAVVTHAFKGGP